MKNEINWKIFFILLGMTLFSIACVFPYVLSVQGELIAKIGQPAGIIFLAQFIQSIILFSIVIFFGLYFAKKINFQVPLLEAMVTGGDYKKILKDILPKSALFGVIIAILIYVTDYLFTLLGASLSTHESFAPIWQKLLAAVYGGVTEEVLMRLFLMSLFIWIGMKIFKQEMPTKTGIVASIVLAAVIFGLGHLPITASLVKIDALIVSRAIVLNGIGGLIFGWLYWKKGLESAMIAHFTTDIVLLSLLPLITA